MKRFALLLFLTASLASNGQEKFRGTIHNGLSAEPISGANIRWIDNSDGTVSGKDGSFSINRTTGTPILIVSYVGFKSDTSEIDLASGRRSTSILLYPAGYEIAAIQVIGVKAIETDPIVQQTISKVELEKRNYGQDIPMILENTPGVVSSSDGGSGVGYTNMRLRGSDQSRINVTINNIPYNDPESHGVFWVNLPDISTSSSSIQIQRGVGSSTNGAGAFGGSVHVRTDALRDKAYGRLDLSMGSYNSFKRNVQFGSGLINGKWVIDGRLSRITTDGYVDRARADLSSYYISLGHYGKKGSLRFVHFSGREETYQAWWGVPESRLNNDVDGMLAHAANNGFDEEDTKNLLNSGRTYNYYLYENQIDNYGQDHYQLHLTRQLATNLDANLSMFYIRGKGFFEEYKKDESLADYLIDDIVIGGDTISNSDIIRRRWLDNHFGGLVFNIQKTYDKGSIVLGGGFNEYRGEHYGRVVWAENNNGTEYDHSYYSGNSTKTDLNLYAKWNYSVGNWDTYLDVQYRTLSYITQGTDNDLASYDINERFNFVNPKVGINYLTEVGKLYAFFGRTNREPIRSDFIDAPNGTKPTYETLNDFELGIEERRNKYHYLANAYFMNYQNQLIPTGALNDVGAVVRENIQSSYRAGIELLFGYQITKSLLWNVNANLGQNKIDKFSYVLYDYTNGYDVITTKYENTDIALSPNVILGSDLAYTLKKVFTIRLMSKYVGKQFLDNTSSDSKSIDAYFINNIQVDLNLDGGLFPEFRIGLLVNNFTNTKYQNFGYTYSYIFGETITENFYYPQALANVHFRITAGF